MFSFRNVVLGIVFGLLFSLLLGSIANAGDHASYYGPGFHGRKTASGERFNQNAMTCAHKRYPFGTRLKVTYRGRSAICRVNDRGPYIRGRTIDLSARMAAVIGLKAAGHGPVRIEVVNPVSRAETRVNPFENLL